MNLAPLLAEFLYERKLLELSGIGRFRLDPGFQAQPDKKGGLRLELGDGVRFESLPSIREMPELVQFLSEKTGKIRALAAADLESHLEVARQFLNIGKPFPFTGIGTVTRDRAGQFHFTPGETILERFADQRLPETGSEDPDNGPESFRSIFYGRKDRKSIRGLAMLTLLVAGVGLAIWGGYRIYLRSASRTPDTETATEKSSIVPKDRIEPAEMTPTAEPDSAAPSGPSVAALPAGSGPAAFKFIVETANRARGLQRYATLKKYGVDIRMETGDSVQFRLFFLQNALSSDTTRIIDSLRRLYTPAGKSAYVTR